jgi:hypothetical protein
MHISCLILTAILILGSTLLSAQEVKYLTLEVFSRVLNCDIPHRLPPIAIQQVDVWAVDTLAFLLQTERRTSTIPTRWELSARRESNRY